MSGRTGTRAGARLAGIAMMLALAGGSAAAATGPGNGYRAKAARLQVQAQLLDTRAHKALLDLYALESRLAGARRTLAVLESRSSRLRERRQVLARELAAARVTLTLSRRRLGDRLRGLYEQGTIDPLAVLLGATSLDDAVTKLNDLSQIADQTRRIVASTSTAHERLTQVAATLAEKRRQLDASLAAARAGERQLASARADRLAFLAGLRKKQRFESAQIRTLLATARAVEAKSKEIQAQAARAAVTDASSSPAPPTTAPDPPAQTTAPAATGPPPSPGTSTLTVSATGYSLPGHTATGLPVGWGVVAVDPSVIPLGTKLTIPGYGEGVAADVGSAVRGATIDLWFPTLAEARAWGRRTVTITIH